MNTLRSLVFVSLMPVLFFLGSEEPTLKEAKIDMRVGQYHLAAVRLERLLKEYPESSHCQEMLTLIVNAYALSHREEEAIAHLRTLLHKFPGASATLDPKLLKLVPPEPPPQSDVPPPVQTAAPSLPVPAMDNRSSAAAPPSSVPSADFAESALSTVQKPVDHVTTNTALSPQLENNTMVVNHAIGTPASGEAPSGEAVPAQPIEELPVRIEVTSTATAAPAVDSAPPDPAVLLTPALQTELPPMEHRNSIASVDSKMPATDTIPFSTALKTAPATAPPPALPDDALDSIETNVKGDHVLVLGDTIHRHEMTFLLKRLRTAGLNPLVSKGERSVVMHRLVSACFDKSPAAARRLRELAGSGAKPFIFREGNSVCAAAGSFADVENAERIRKHLERKGITTHIAESKMVLSTWRVTSEKFPDILTAEEAMRRLALKGIEAVVEPL